MKALGASGRWVQIEPILDQALELDATAQAAYLDQACPDPQLREQIEALLVADQAAEDLLTTGESIGVQANVSAVGSRIGPFELVEPIAEGGMGRVFLGRRVDGEFDQAVAVKFLSLSVDQKAQQYFQAECQNLARLDHPNIVHLLDGGVTESGASYLVLQYIEGESIDRFVATERAALRQRMQLFIQLCEAVQYAHRHLIVHRDLKPSNVLVTTAGQVKLLDFGISRDLQDDGTATSSMMTPRYAAPEQILGQPITTSTDIYGLGMLLHQLLTGQAPFAETDGSIESLVTRAKRAEPPLPSALANGSSDDVGIGRRRLRGDLDAIMLRCLQADPARRYDSVAALRDDVRAWLDGRTISARRPGIFNRFARWINRHRWTTAATASLLVLVALAGNYHLRAVQQERDGAVATTNFLIQLIQNINPNNSSKDGALEFPITELYEAGLQQLPRSKVPVIEKSRLARAFSNGLSAAGDQQQAFISAEAAVGLAATHAPNGLVHIEAVTRRAAAATNLYNFAQAERDYQWLIARIGDQVQPQSIEAAIIWNDYGMMLNTQGKPNDAEASFRRALGVVEQLSLDSIVKQVTLATLANLSTTISRVSGDNDEAWRLAYRQIALATEWHGEDHITTAQAYANAAILGGRLEEETRMAKRAFEIAGRVLGRDHGQTITMQNNYALQLNQQDRVDQAIGLLEDVIERYQNQAEPDLVSLADGYQNLSVMLRKRDRLETADSYATNAANIYDDALPTDHWRHGLPLLTRAEIALASARPEDALGLSLAALERFSQLPNDGVFVLAGRAMAAIANVDIKGCLDTEQALADEQINTLRSSIPYHPLNTHLPRLEQAQSCQ